LKDEKDEIVGRETIVIKKTSTTTYSIKLIFTIMFIGILSYLLLQFYEELRTNYKWSNLIAYYVVALNLPLPMDWTEDVKRNNTVKYCKILGEAIRSYNSQERKTLQSTDMVELSPAYIPDVKMMKDVWGGRFYNDSAGRVVFSMGPDGRHDYSNQKSICNKDDVSVKY